MAARSRFVEVEEAPVARWLFASTAAAWIWLAALVLGLDRWLLPRLGTPWQRTVSTQAPVRT